jgi:hypothetical protein
MPFTEAEWVAATSWEEYLAGVVKHADLWRHHWEHAEVDGLTRARLRDLEGPRRVLILSEDWCGDAVRSVPTLVRACEVASDVEVRLLDIANHPDTIDRHLTKGGRAIPVAIVMDADGNDYGWWGPRPAPLQKMLRRQLFELGPPAKGKLGEFYAPVMGWYKKDGGKTTLEEFTLLLERG